MEYKANIGDGTSISKAWVSDGILNGPKQLFHFLVPLKDMYIPRVGVQRNSVPEWIRNTKLQSCRH